MTTIGKERPISTHAWAEPTRSTPPSTSTHTATTSAAGRQEHDGVLSALARPRPRAGMSQATALQRRTPVETLRAHASGAKTLPPAPEAQATLQANRIVRELRDAGVDLRAARNAVSSAMWGNAVHMDAPMAQVLQRHFGAKMSGSPGVLELHAALKAAVPVAPAASQPNAAPKRTQAHRPVYREFEHEFDMNRLSALLDGAGAARAQVKLPAREAQESDLQYALRVRTLNPKSDATTIALAMVGPRTGREQSDKTMQLYHTLHDVKDVIKTRDTIRAMFDSLPAIPKAEAEHMGFKDAAIHKDDATHCPFGGPLSTSNANQRVIALAYDTGYTPGNLRGAAATGRKRVAFMDLNALADHLATQSRQLHPMHPPEHAQPLHEENIEHYAFRIA